LSYVDYVIMLAIYQATILIAVHPDYKISARDIIRIKTMPVPDLKILLPASCVPSDKNLIKVSKGATAMIIVPERGNDDSPILPFPYGHYAIKTDICSQL